MAAEHQQLRLTGVQGFLQGARQGAGLHLVAESGRLFRQAHGLVLDQLVDQGTLGEQLGVGVGVVLLALEHVQGVDVSLARQQQAGLVQGGAGAQGEVDGGHRAAVGRVLVTGGKQQRHRAATGDAVQGGAGEELVALVMGAEHQQVGATLLHLLQHALGGFALAQAQLAAGGGEFGEAAVEQAFDALALGLIQARIEDMQERELGVVLAGQLGGAPQREVCSTAQVMGNKDVSCHLVPSVARLGATLRTSAGSCMELPR
jgi:hypothetical protein